MVTPSRNAPCPCGSGRKYKHCCLPRQQAADREAASAEAARPVRAASEHPWEVGIYPVAARLEDQPDQRVSLAAVAAGGLILHMDFVTGALGRPDDVVDAYEAALDAAERHVGVAPAEVHVRDDALARSLAVRLALRGVPVHVRPRLPGLEDAARALNRDQFDTDALPLLGAAPTWSAWGLSPARTRALFAAAARYRRAAPWDRLDDVDAIRTFSRLARVGDLTACVLGGDGGPPGLALFTDSRDHQVVAETGLDLDAWIEELRGTAVSLTFVARDDLERGMQREVASAGWEVADPAGYPVLLVVGSPAGGIDPALVDVLIAFLLAIPDFVDALDDELGDALAGENIDWEHEPTGLRLRFDVPGGFEWPVPDRLATGGPAGPGAEPAAVLPPPDGPEDAFPELDLVDDFEAGLRGSFADATVARHARNAAALIEMLNGRHGAPVRALHELDLRAFLYDHFPRQRPGYGPADTLPASLRRFFEFLAERHGLEFPWAEPILADKHTLLRRASSAPTGRWWDPDVVDYRADLYADLDRRVMLLPTDWAGALEDTALLGADEDRLRRVAQRLWLAWRDELIAAGTDQPVRLRQALDERLRDWLAGPDPDDPAGRTRLEVLEAERQDHPRHEQEKVLRALLGDGE